MPAALVLSLKDPEQMRLRSHLNRRLDPLLDNEVETQVFKKG